MTNSSGSDSKPRLFLGYGSYFSFLRLAAKRFGLKFNLYFWLE